MWWSGIGGAIRKFLEGDEHHDAAPIGASPAGPRHSTDEPSAVANGGQDDPPAEIVDGPPPQAYQLVVAREFGEEYLSGDAPLVELIFTAMGLDEPFFQITKLRRFNLPFYKGAGLYYATLRKAPDAPGDLMRGDPDRDYSEHFVVLNDPEAAEGPSSDGPEAIWLDRTNEPIYSLNDDMNDPGAGTYFLGPLDASGLANIALYSRFFFDNVRGTLGLFTLLPDKSAALKWLEAAGAPDLQSLSGRIAEAFENEKIGKVGIHPPPPPRVPVDDDDDFEGESLGWWSQRMLVGFKNALFATDIDVRQDGRVRLSNEKLILEELPINPSFELERFHDLPILPALANCPKRFRDQFVNSLTVSADEFLVLYGKFSRDDMTRLENLMRAVFPPRDGDPNPTEDQTWGRYVATHRELHARIQGPVFVRGEVKGRGYEFNAIRGSFIFQDKVDFRFAAFEEGLDLSDCAFFKTVDLSFAKVFGDLSMARAEIRFTDWGLEFGTEASRSKISDTALLLRNIDVSGDLMLAGMSSIWSSPGKDFFHILATDMKIGGSVILNALRCGELDLSGSKIHGDVQLGRYIAVDWRERDQIKAQPNASEAEPNVLRLCPPHIFELADIPLDESHTFPGTFAKSINLRNVVARKVTARLRAPSEDDEEVEEADESSDGLPTHSIWVNGQFMLDGARFDGEVSLIAPFVAGQLSLHGAKAMHVQIESERGSARLGGCDIGYARIEGNIDFSGLEVGGGRALALDITGFGDLSVQGTYVGGTVHANNKWRAGNDRPLLVAGKLDLSYSRIDKNLSLMGVKVGDEICLHNTKIGGSIDTTRHASTNVFDKTACTHFTIQGLECQGNVNLWGLVVLNPRCHEEDAESPGYYKLLSAQYLSGLGGDHDVAELYGLAEDGEVPLKGHGWANGVFRSRALSADDFTILVPERKAAAGKGGRRDIQNRPIPLEPGILAQHASIQGTLALCDIHVRGVEKHAVSDWSNTGWIFGKLDCSQAKIGRLLLPSLTFGRPSDEMKDAEFHRRRCPTRRGRLRLDDEASLHESFGVSLEGCEVGRFELAPSGGDNGAPFSINLTGAKIGVWDRNADLLGLLKCDIHKAAITYRMIQHEYAARGDDKRALQTFVQLRRNYRRWYDVFGRLQDWLWAYFTKPIRWQWIPFAVAWFMVSWLCIFSNPDNIALNPETADTLHLSAGTKPQNWDAGDGFWVALREHVPIISVIGRFEWGPASFAYAKVPQAARTAAKGATAAVKDAKPQPPDAAAVDSAKLASRPLVVSFGTTRYMFSNFTAEGYAAFIVIVFTILWTVGIAVFAAGAVQKRAAGS